ncbi:MAG: hypothetical protein PHD10_05315 [Bacilli bacterium]|nr:hypothetical protein [Bacilli bacterium]MDD4608524.1 hypothetical protein [Bacilli bacterium]
MIQKPFNFNPMGTPMRKIRDNNDSIGGRREITDIKREMLDTTRPELKKSYIAKYHRETNDNMNNNNEDLGAMQRNKIDALRRINKGL